MKLEKYPGNPILSPEPSNPWESFSVCNPAACYDEISGTVYMLYRGADADSAYTRCIGLATSKDGVHFVRAGDQPVLRPEPDRWDGGALEDPRITRIGDWFFVTYVAYPRPQGPVWKPLDQWLRIDYPDCFPGALKWNITSVGLALTKDFKSFKRVGPITNAWDNDRNTMLFPEKAGGRWWRLHRPMRRVGQAWGCAVPSIWISHSEDTLHWPLEHSTLLLTPRHDLEGTKIGANTPPIKTAHGWFFLYHGVSRTDSHYRLGAVLLDLESPTRVLHRTRDWIMEPTEDFELNGLYREGGVVFPCGTIVKDGRLMVYYGGGDKHIGLASCDFDALLEELVREPA